MWARTLARYGVNIVRLHFVDKWAPTGITDGSKDDTRSFDAQQLDRLDFLVSELKKNGIYMDLNLNVGRAYKEGDGVPDAARLQWAKSLTLYDKRLIELEKEYAHNLLTHVNPYTKTEYRNEPAIAIVEILNENGIGQGYNPPSKFYADELDGIYNTWLKANLTAEQLQKLREEAGVQGDALIPRLPGNARATAPKDRYETEVRFFMDLENGFYQDMKGYLRDLGVKQPLIGTADHGHSGPPWVMLTSLSKLDILDGHIYWNQYVGVGNVPMVNDPLHSTVVQLSRTAFAGKPYTVSETNHPFPNEYASEGIPILAAYAGFQDWDMIIVYTFEPKKDPAWKPYVGDPFDISLDPVRMTEMAAGALMFLRLRREAGAANGGEDILQGTSAGCRAACRPDCGRAANNPTSRPVFRWRCRWSTKFASNRWTARRPRKFTAWANAGPIVSDTKELTWYTSDAKTGLVTVETDRAQALIGFIKANHKTLKNLGAEITNNFATIVLTSMDDKPLARSDKMLLNACSRVANTDQKWNDAHSRVGTGRPGPFAHPDRAGDRHGDAARNRGRRSPSVRPRSMDPASPSAVRFLRKRRPADGRSRLETRSPRGTCYQSAGIERLLASGRTPDPLGDSPVALLTFCERLLSLQRGRFMWTGIDYLGESGWPNHGATSGCIDSCGFPKDGYYFYQSQWSGKPMVHLFPHWNWKGREAVPDGGVLHQLRRRRAVSERQVGGAEGLRFSAIRHARTLRAKRPAGDERSAHHVRSASLLGRPL